MARELTYHYRLHQDGTIQQLIPHHEWSTRMTNHIDQLTEWWEAAEKGTAHAGDTVIRREGEDVYQVYTLDVGPIGKWGDIRILTRAPKPVPAWHNGIAVMATADAGGGDMITGVWVRDGGTNYWESVAEGDLIHADYLRDVTPLIEAKVTDEMVLRALNAEYEHEKPLEWYARGSILGMRAALQAALDLDPA